MFLALKQNKELREKLKQIHETSNISQISPVVTPDGLKITRATSITEDDIDIDEKTVIHEPLAQSVSRDSTSVLSISEYFDAEENLSADTTSTEDEDEESIVTDLSDDGTEYRTSKKSLENVSLVANTTGRRSQLPAQQPDSGIYSFKTIIDFSLILTSSQVMSAFGVFCVKISERICRRSQCL